MRRSLEVFPDRRLVLRLQPGFVEGFSHVRQPRVALGRSDRERRVAQAQARVAAVLVIGARAAPVLHQEEAQTLLGRGEFALRVQRAQDRVAAHTAVEAPDQPPEGVFPSGGFVERGSRQYGRLAKKSITLSTSPAAMETRIC